MTYQERLDDYIRDEAWVHMQNLCRELIAKLSDDRDRLRRRDEVVREWLRQDEEMAGYGAGLADRLAAIEFERMTDAITGKTAGLIMTEKHNAAGGN